MAAPIRDSNDAYSVLSAQNWPKSCEAAIIMPLDGRNAPLRTEIMTVGLCHDIHVSIRAMASIALADRACGLIIAHNHIEGDLRPSLNDIAATRRIALWLRPLGIRLVDHLIVGEGRYASLRDLNVL